MIDVQIDFSDYEETIVFLLSRYFMTTEETRGHMLIGERLISIRTNGWRNNVAHLTMYGSETTDRIRFRDDMSWVDWEAQFTFSADGFIVKTCVGDEKLLLSDLTYAKMVVS